VGEVVEALAVEVEVEVVAAMEIVVASKAVVAVVGVVVVTPKAIEAVVGVGVVTSVAIVAAVEVIVVTSKVIEAVMAVEAASKGVVEERLIEGDSLKTRQTSNRTGGMPSKCRPGFESVQARLMILTTIVIVFTAHLPQTLRSLTLKTKFCLSPKLGNWE
jgi:hypothetical protein